jgi:hypothetical protein
MIPGAKLEPITAYSHRRAHRHLPLRCGGAFADERNTPFNEK